MRSMPTGGRPGAFGLGIDRLEYSRQARPWHHAVHLIEELFSAGEPAILLKRDLGKCLLRQGCASRSVLRYP